MSSNNSSFKLNKPPNKNTKDIVLTSIDYLTQMYNFATLRDTEEIYYYNSYKGIFVPNGDKFIKDEVVANHRSIDTKDMNEIINHIKWETYVDRNEFDANIEWIACKNCMVNLITGETKSHAAEFMATVQIPVFFKKNSLSLSNEYSKNGINSHCPKIMSL